MQAKKALADAKKKHNAAKKAKLTFTVTLDQITNSKWWKNTQKYTDAVKSRKEVGCATESGTVPYTNYVAGKILSLPCWPYMTDDEISYVVEKFNSIS